MRRFLVGCAIVAGCGSGSSPGDGGADGPTGDLAGRDLAVTPGDMAGGGGDLAVQPSAPGLRLFFTDLVSGPNSGGEGGNGAYVTLYGLGFGAAQGTSSVTIGGGAAAGYPIWSDGRITVQLGAAAASGDIVVHVAGNGDSNGLPFTVRAGNIFFASGGGSDGYDGSFGKPWATIPMAKNTVGPGDIAYIGAHAGDAVAQTTEDSSSPYSGALGMSVNDGTNSGTKDLPKALVVYPGATGTIGVESGLARGIIVPAINGTFDYWVIAGFTIRGESEAIELEGGSTGWRIVGNDVSCPNGSGQSGCVTGGDATSPSDLKFFGNDVHDCAANVGTITKYYHGIYFGSSHLELGWNTVRDGKTCRAVQFHDSGGPNNFDLSVHDNVIHGTVCDGLNFASVDPSQGTVEAYNNVIYDVGRGPDPADGSSDYACIYVANITNQGAPGSGSVMLYNNTLYDCGPRGTSAAGAIARAAGPVGIQMVDNLIAVTGSEAYFSGDTDTSMIGGSNNLFFGGGAAPGFVTMSQTGDPAFVSAAGADFHLLPASAAIDHGAMTAAATDRDGNLRPQGPAFDIGAYEAVK
jgi:hypothetical protein